MCKLLLGIVSVLLLNKGVQNTDVNPRFYPKYHLAPPGGWMNDPNGFCIFKNEYHLFYQHNPKSSHTSGIVHWGHAKSKDLFHWEHLPIALYPDESYDVDGVFSGSAIVENDTMYLIYTGNINRPGETPDHEQHQNLAYGTDGVKFTKSKYNPVILGNNKQPDFRDPNIWKHEDTFYVVLGNSEDNEGKALLYTSTDLLSWEEAATLDTSNDTLGYMWECPDFFELDGKFVLLFSPQGIKPEGDKYKNLYQAGYIVGNFDYKTNKFNSETSFQELDHGHDFYATQTMETEDGRRILIAWLDMWEETYPEQNDGWTGQMSVPRELSLSKEGKLLQKPAKELEKARGKKLYDGEVRSYNKIKIKNNSAEIKISAAADKNLEVSLVADDDSQNIITLSYNYSAGQVTLDRGGNDGVRRTEWKPRGGDLEWRLLLDSSSLELFCGEGEVTFSSRFFPEGEVSLYFDDESKRARVQVVTIDTTVPAP